MCVRRQLKDARAAAQAMMTAPGAADFLEQFHGSPPAISVSPKVRRFSSRDRPMQSVIARYREYKGAGDSLPRVPMTKPAPEDDRRCEHCCEIFRTVLELKGHIEVCSLNSKTRCRHCSKRFACKVDKTEHEVVCEFNPDNCCEWCGKIFGHQTLKNRHQQRCPMDPKRICSFCQKGFRSNAETVQHEVFCGMNPKTNAVNADCVACGDATRCVRFPCGDHYCASCLWALVQVALSDRSLLPLRCCKKPVEAGDVVDLTVALLLPEKQCKKYQEAMLLKSSRNVMYCPRISCGALISLDHVPKEDMLNPDEPYGCPSCHWPAEVAETLSLSTTEDCN